MEDNEIKYQIQEIRDAILGTYDKPGMLSEIRQVRLEMSCQKNSCARYRKQMITWGLLLFILATGGSALADPAVRTIVFKIFGI